MNKPNSFSNDIVILIKQLSIIDVASRLGIKILNNNKANCFGGHDKKTPSLSFHIKNNSWKCFGCELKGDIISLVQKYNSCDFITALEWFNNEFNLNYNYTFHTKSNNFVKKTNITGIRNRKLLQVKLETDAEFQPDYEIYKWLIANLKEVTNPVGVKYLTDHAILPRLWDDFLIREISDSKAVSETLVKKWGIDRVFKCGLFWAKNAITKPFIWDSYTLIFPFIDQKGICYLQGRRFEKKPKFLNLLGVQKPIYNSIKMAKLSSGSVIHICEGVPDTLALEGQGLPTVGVLGASSFRKEWVDRFLKFNVVLMPDGDNGGRTFEKMITEYFSSRGKPVESIILPENLDVSEAIMKNNEAI